MIIILFKSLGKRTSIGSYYDEKSLTKCYWDGVSGFFASKKPLTPSPNGPQWSCNVAISTFKCPLVRCLPEIIFAMLSADTTKAYGREMKYFLKKKECRMYMKICRE